MPEPVVDERTLWRLLGEPRRHHVLRHLAEADGATTMSEIAEAVVEHCDDDRELLYVELRHVDLPMLADAGVISYDPGRDRIEPSARVEPLCDALAAVEASLGSPREIR